MRRLPLLLACLSAALGGAGAVHAQEPEPAEPAGETPAPEPGFVYIAPRFALGVTVGTPGLGDLHSQPATVTRVVVAGNGKIVTDSDPLTRTVRAEGGFQVGISGILSLDDAWAVRLGGSYGRATLATVYAGPDSAAAAVAAVSRLAEAESGEIRTTALEAALRYRIASTRRARPFLELGAAALRLDADGGAAAAGIPETETAIAATAAVGVVVPITAWLSGEIQAETRVFRNPVRAVDAGSTGPENSILAVTLGATDGALFGDAEREALSGARLSLGLRVGLGSVPPPPPEPPAEPASTSPPGR